MANFGVLGFLAGMGDRAHEENIANDRKKAQDRDNFAEDLRRVMESEDWPEQARLAAAHARMELFQNPKLKQKDYGKIWETVRGASRRPGFEPAETAAARSSIPALQNLSQTVGQSPGVAPAQPSGLTMQRPGQERMELLRPPDPDGTLVTESTKGMLGLQPPPQGDTLVQPRSFSGAIQDATMRNQGIVERAGPPPADVYGPTTQAERNRQQIESLKAAQDFHLQDYRKRKEIDNEFRPDKYTIGADGQIILNQTEGTYELTGITKPEDKTEMESETDDWIATNGMENTPKNRLLARNAIRRDKAIAARDPEAAARWQATFDATQRLRDEMVDQRMINNAENLQQVYNKQLDTAKQSKRYAQAMREAAHAASLGGDLWLIFSTMRALDPGSVVREQEYRVANELGGPWHSLMGKINQLRGTGVLDSMVRGELEALANKIEQQSITDEKLINDHYRRVADARDLPYDMVGIIGAGTGNYIPGSARGRGRRPVGPPGTETTAPVAATPGDAILEALAKKLGVQ